MACAVLTTLSHVFGAEASPGQEAVDLQSTRTQGEVISKTSNVITYIKNVISFNKGMCVSLTGQRALQMTCAV